MKLVCAPLIARDAVVLSTRTLSLDRTRRGRAVLSLVRRGARR
jgi:hypothetical protein